MLPYILICIALNNVCSYSYEQRTQLIPRAKNIREGCNCKTASYLCIQTVPRYKIKILFIIIPILAEDSHEQYFTQGAPVLNS